MGRNWLRPRTAASVYLAKCGSKSCAHEHNFFTGWVGSLTTQLYSCAQLFGSLFTRSMLTAVRDVFTDRTTTNTQMAIACARSTKYKAFSIKSYPLFYPRSQALTQQYWKGWEAGQEPRCTLFPTLRVRSNYSRVTCSRIQNLLSWRQPLGEEAEAHGLCQSTWSRSDMSYEDHLLLSHCSQALARRALEPDYHYSTTLYSAFYRFPT